VRVTETAEDVMAGGNCLLRLISADEDLRRTATAVLLTQLTGERLANWIPDQQVHDLENMRIGCGVLLQEQIRMMSKNCLNAMGPALFTTEKLSQTAC